MTQTTSTNYFCHVCGAPLGDFAPWGEDGLSPTHGICDCCGVEYGYEDYILSSLITFKANWLSSGGHWKNPNAKPMGLSLERQLQCVPDRPPAGVRLIERPSEYIIDCHDMKCEEDFWKAYLAVVNPDGTQNFGRNLDAFWDAVSAGGPGWPGECTLRFINTDALAAWRQGEFVSRLREIAAESTSVVIRLE
jgi:hypothetical protein